MELILASGSPRRHEMISGLGLSFTICIPDVDESSLEKELPLDYVKRIASKKAEAVFSDLNEENENLLILSADTIVVLGEQILGKPKDAEDAKKTLKMLSGKTHEVITSFCVKSAEKEIVTSISTKVQFAEISDAEIEAYVSTGEPMDKAGSYAIQGGAAYMVRKIDGSYSNVVGLPLCEVIETLKEFGVTLN